MQDKILSYIKRYELFFPGERVLVAVSGGADSVALLCALHEVSASLDISLVVAHLNHCIRGKEADADAAFVKKLAQKLDLQCICGRTDVPKLVKRGGVSMEMAARSARYDFLARTARKVKADVVATAHTADDQAETVLLKLARGTGPRGLAGISRKVSIDGLTVVRPLLDVRRSEIEKYLREKRQVWREDKTNLDSAYLRNRVRHEVLPFLEKKLNPDIRAALIRTADLLREEDNWLEKLSAEILEKCVERSTIAPLTLALSPKGRGNTTSDTCSRTSTKSTQVSLLPLHLGEPPSPRGYGGPRRIEVRGVDSSSLLLANLKSECLAAKRRVVRLWLVSAGVSPELIDYDVVARVEALLEVNGTGSTEIAENWIVKRRYDRLIVKHGPGTVAKSFRHIITIPGKTLLAGVQLRIVTSLKSGLVKDRGHIGQYPAKASISLPAADKQKIIVRSWQNGDRMKPFGMTGSKKLHHIFVDEKVPVEERGNIPVFECAGEIIWIPGYRIARGWEVKDQVNVSLQIMVETNKQGAEPAPLPKRLIKKGFASKALKSYK